MAEHRKFHFSTLEQLRDEIARLGADISLSDDLAVLARPVAAGRLYAPNAFAVLPMEGCDCLQDGSPSELTRRRYLRLFGGGAGLIWWEACAVVPEGRANPRQMMLTEGNLRSFTELVRDAKREAALQNSPGHRPVSILQLTHSGRYSRPNSHRPEPIIPQNDPILDPLSGVTENTPLAADEYLASLPEKYARSAVLAREAGFDGVDIKSCHRYLFSELLASHTREGIYGGSFENRTRLLLDTVRAVREAVGDDFMIACRFNVFDAHPYPYGFGSAKDDPWTFDPEEPMMLVQLLRMENVQLLSNSAGNPYYIYPQVTRPFDTSSLGIPVPREDPLESVARLFAFTAAVQQAAPDLPVVGNGYSWLRQFLPYAGAANLKNGKCGFVGLGRSSFAYPQAPRDILSGRGMKEGNCCVTCSKCTQIMRDHGKTGCVVRDSEVYAPLYRCARESAEERERSAEL